ncbi:MAG TPA: hypothetical protein DFR83_26350 [Deltaproteobacteria bacterium]|nr:hypothetical protein [Deltaproteobacteria bacterium]
MSTPTRLRFFTPTEASVALARVLPKLERAARSLGTYRQLRDRLETNEAMDEDARIAVANEVARQRDLIHTAVEEINDEGVEVAGIDPPALAFPALLAGREVVLSWKYGERAVAWWHERDDGPAGRKPIAGFDSGLWEWLN